MTAPAVEFTPEQAEAVEAFIAATMEFMPAMQRLEEVGLSLGDVVRQIPNENGGSVYDDLPPMLRMLL